MAEGVMSASIGKQEDREKAFKLLSAERGCQAISVNSKALSVGNLLLLLYSWLLR